ncbi:formate dehydrogenase family accessory protein FdhD [Pseudolabrys sp. Root1462]|uniref:formate dehydrogenase accessory sulfurtransferase FdhD n=1 Tax=Pseudolabrys sp. Root1462 TaxID=1736466 RepID=UPI0007032E05|nr:formate dehydrogenase accessory sulfurtransferase FdhD [Pseudolabrys sp. Root1462]KQZ00515.1 formate dehydrogenase family accessory protein FdhD [Pseudolabrys sp. Root1462]
MPGPVRTVERLAWRAGRFTSGERAISEETAVAFTYNGTTYAVMMATPQDLEDFAVGFTVTEGLVASPDEIERIEVLELEAGIELQMRLNESRAGALAARRRFLAGPTGCGLCGIESLTEAMRPLQPLADHVAVSPRDIMRAMAALPDLQTINQQTHAVHGAAFYRPADDGLIMREDVGRHNALDKLCGALLRDDISRQSGFALVTSRLSIEMIQKAATVGIPILVAVSAPTALAVRAADSVGMTLVAVARSDGFEVFTHPQRIKEERSLHVVAG